MRPVLEKGGVNGYPATDASTPGLTREALGRYVSAGVLSPGEFRDAEPILRKLEKSTGPQSVGTYSHKQMPA